MDYPYTVPEIENLLLGRVQSLADALLPGGRRVGAERLNGFALGHDLSSFSLNLATGKWLHGGAARRSARDFPLLSLIAYLVCDDRWKSEGGRPGAIRWAQDWLGLTGRAPDPARSAAAAEEAERLARRRAETEAREAEKRRQAAYAMWLNARPLSEGDPVWQYLSARGIDLARLPKVPGALRFDPACRYYRGARDYVTVPAMLAAMHLEGRPGGFAAVHRTYLALENGAWRKAFGRQSKKILGAKAGATIRLTKGASGKPLARAPAGEWPAIGEGIENALSAALARPEMRVLAAGTLENIGKVVLPKQIGGVRILADNDPFGSAAEAGLEKVCNALLDRGIDLEIYRAPSGYKDFNDALTGTRRESAQGGVSP